MISWLWLLPVAHNAPLSFLKTENFLFISTSISGCSGKNTTEIGRDLKNKKKSMDRNVKIVLVSAMKIKSYTRLHYHSNPFKSRTLCAGWWQQIPTVLECRSFGSKTIFIHILPTLLKFKKILTIANILVIQMLLCMCLNNHYKQINF